MKTLAAFRTESQKSSLSLAKSSNETPDRIMYLFAVPNLESAL